MGQNPQADAGCQPKALPMRRQSHQTEKKERRAEEVQGTRLLLLGVTHRPWSTLQRGPGVPEGRGPAGLLEAERNVPSADVAGETPRERKPRTQAWSRQGPPDSLVLCTGQDRRRVPDPELQSVSLPALSTF